MAAFVIRTCIKQSHSRRLLSDIIRNDSITKRIAGGLIAACDQCYLFHTAPVYFKRRKTGEEKKAKNLIEYSPKSKEKQKEAVPIWKNMTVAELAESSRRDMDDIFEAMMYINDSFSYNKPSSIIDNPKVIQEIVRKLGAKCKTVPRPDSVTEQGDKKDCDVFKRPPPDPAVTIKRHPVVTVMGHVDHGKTTLLDSLRNTSVVDGEFGGITQHIGAFNVTLESGEKITFLDTPGHAAFSTMRARGANATDIVVLVVAADDGVMEQTVQSIRMAKEANVPIIVAINKIDKPDADIERTKKMLSQHGIMVEDLGGDVQSVNISALKGTNVHGLAEAVAAQAELMDLRGDPTGFIEGVVLESSNNPGRGKLATALVQRGTLRKGAVLVCGLAWAKVRAMFDHAGNPVLEAKLSDAVEIIGWRELPMAGDEILEVESERKAHEVLRVRHALEAEKKAIDQYTAAEQKHQQHLVEYRAFLEKKRMMGRFRMKRDGPRPKELPRDDGFPKVNIVLKGDVAGSVEAIMDVLETYSSEDKCRLDVVHYGVGNVAENDVELAKTFNAIIYSFNVTTPEKVRDLAKDNRVSIRPHNVIYRLIDDLKAEISSKLPPASVDEVLGEANVLQTFVINEGKKKVNVAGCRCTKGVLKKSAMYRLMRGTEVVHVGKLSSMRHLKNEVDTIKNGVECGLRLDDQQVEFKSGDILVCFSQRDEPQKTDWDPGF